MNTVRCELVGVDLPDLRGQRVDQIAVMCHQQDRALIGIQDRLQYLLRRNVQVVGGLIQQQEIGILQGKFRQRQPPAFAAGKHGHFLEGVIAGEQIPADVVAALGGQHAGRGRQDLVQHRLFRVQPLVRLRKIADVQAGTENHLAAQRFELAQDGFQERGLAGAVRADQRRAVRPPQLDIRGAEEQPAGIAHLQSTRADDEIA